MPTVWGTDRQINNCRRPLAEGKPSQPSGRAVQRQLEEPKNKPKDPTRVYAIDKRNVNRRFPSN